MSDGGGLTWWQPRTAAPLDTGGGSEAMQIRQGQAMVARQGYADKARDRSFD